MLKNIIQLTFCNATSLALWYFIQLWIYF